MSLNSYKCFDSPLPLQMLEAFAGGHICVTGKVVAVQVPEHMMPADTKK